MTEATTPRRYLTPPTPRGRNHVSRGDGTRRTLCSSTPSRHAAYVLADEPRPDTPLCIQCERIEAAR